MKSSLYYYGTAITTGIVVLFGGNDGCIQVSTALSVQSKQKALESEFLPTEKVFCAVLGQDLCPTGFSENINVNRVDQQGEDIVFDKWAPRHFYETDDKEKSFRYCANDNITFSGLCKVVYEFLNYNTTLNHISGNLEYVYQSGARTLKRTSACSNIYDCKTGEAFNLKTPTPISLVQKVGSVKSSNTCPEGYNAAYLQAQFQICVANDLKDIDITCKYEYQPSGTGFDRIVNRGGYIFVVDDSDRDNVFYLNTTCDVDVLMDFTNGKKFNPIVPHVATSAPITNPTSAPITNPTSAPITNPTSAPITNPTLSPMNTKTPSSLPTTNSASYLRFSIFSIIVLVLFCDTI